MGFIIFKALKTNHGALLQAYKPSMVVCPKPTPLLFLLPAQRLLVADGEGLYIFIYQHTEITLTQEK